jgi:hypothetical protein
MRLLVSATSFSAVLFTIFLLSMFTNWLQYKGLTFPGHDNNYKNHGDFDIPRPISNAKASLSSLRNMNELDFRLPETKDLSISSNVDVEDLGIQLANKSVNVYKPGMLIVIAGVTI